MAVAHSWLTTPSCCRTRGEMPWGVWCGTGSSVVLGWDLAATQGAHRITVARATTEPPSLGGRQSSRGTDYLSTAWHTRHCAARSRTWLAHSQPPLPFLSSQKCSRT